MLRDFYVNQLDSNKSSLLCIQNEIKTDKDVIY